MLLPSLYYARYCEQNHLTVDPEQLQTLAEFDRIITALANPPATEPSLWQRLKTRFQETSDTGVKGLYLWGGVGRGKTMLMDLFVHCLQQPPATTCERIHYHAFMQSVHQQLQLLGNIESPLPIIAKRLAETCQVLCIDEFLVNDITDAMLLAGLLDALFEEQVLLVTTSNRPPDDLYKNGLQRARFLPAIQLIKQHTIVHELDSPTDYRLQTLQREGTYFQPLTKPNKQLFQQCFDELTTGRVCEPAMIDVNGRCLEVLAECKDILSVSFVELCMTARSQSDYIELACRYPTVFVHSVPVMSKDSDDAARRLLNMLDVFYDHAVKLIVLAAAPINQLYTGKRLRFEFDRAESRLFEMQSVEYLARPHQPVRAEMTAVKKAV